MHHFLRCLMLFAATLLWVPAHGESSAFTVQVNSSAATPIQVVAAILEKRFDSIKPGFFDSVSPRVNGNSIRVQCSGWAPTKEEADYLLRTTGRLKATMRGEQDTALIADADIAEARTIDRDSKTELAIRLTDAAASRVESLTRNGSGKEVILAWDGQTIARLRLAGPLPRDFALTLPARYDPRLMSAALRGGRLPEGVKLTPAS